MNVRDIILPALLTFATMFLINQFFTPQQDSSGEGVQPGQSFTAMPQPELSRPLQKYIDFSDSSKAYKGVLILFMNLVTCN